MGTHGTFIAGLVSAASALNPALSGALEPGGCKFFDLAPPIDPDHREEAIWVQLEAYPPP